MENRVYLPVRWLPEVKAGLAKAAEADHRSLSAMTELIVSDWLRSHGFLKREPPDGSVKR